MIDKRVASAQMERLSGLDWYPRDGVPQIELISAIECAFNEFIAAHVINEWLKYETQCPKPAEIRRLIWVENDKLKAVHQAEEEERNRNRVSCPFCHGFGIVESIRSAPIESVASYCHCPLGKRREALLNATEGNPEWDEYSVPVINAARAKLRKLTGKNAIVAAMLKKTERSTAFERIEAPEVYNGEF